MSHWHSDWVVSSRLAIAAICILALNACGESDSPRPPTPRSGAALTTTTLTPTADSFVKSGSPNQVQGALGYLRVNDSGNNRALVRFDEAAIASAVGTGTLTAAFLELDIVDNANNWSADGRAVDVHRGTNNAWAESGAT